MDYFSQFEGLSNRSWPSSDFLTFSRTWINHARYVTVKNTMLQVGHPSELNISISFTVLDTIAWYRIYSLQQDFMYTTHRQFKNTASYKGLYLPDIITSSGNVCNFFKFSSTTRGISTLLLQQKYIFRRNIYFFLRTMLRKSKVLIFLVNGVYVLYNLAFKLEWSFNWHPLSLLRQVALIILSSSRLYFPTSLPGHFFTTEILFGYRRGFYQ